MAVELNGQVEQPDTKQHWSLSRLTRMGRALADTCRLKLALVAAGELHKLITLLESNRLEAVRFLS